MTKEELLSKASAFAEVSSKGVDVYRDLLELFNSNICIPIGENRHPYADVLHEWIEDTSKQIEGSYPDSNFWKPINGFLSKEYRIKPSEPVWEYQWLDFRTSGEAYIMVNAKYMTDNEAHSLVSYSEIKPIKETKRERK